MSKPADKAANRSAIKAAGDAIFAKPKPEHRADSWWTTASGPADRAKFMEAAKARAEHQWTGLGSFKST